MTAKPVPPMHGARALASAGIRHGFFTRRGGVSHRLYASLNCSLGSGDEADHVRENRRRVAQRLGLQPGRLLTLFQVHSAKAVILERPWESRRGPEADAVATRTPGLGLGILTADCTPILLADVEHRVIGAAHAGWKGALGGVIRAVIGAMESLGAEPATIRAAIGPTISQAAYEVGPELRAGFIAAAESNARFFAPSPRADRRERWHFDLPGFVAAALREEGVAAVETLGLCTYAGEDDFFSFRRATHRAESDYGRNISVIGLDAA